MDALSANGALGANIQNGKSAARETTDGKSAVDDENWFSEAARALHQSKPGTIMFLTTGLGDERLCQRYAAENNPTKPPAYFLRALLRSDHGWQWLCATMAGSEVEWWRDIQLARRRSAAIDKADVTE